MDLITITDELGQAGHLELAGGPPGLALLIEQACIAAYLDDYIAIIKADRTKRELTAFAMQIASTAQNGTPAREALSLARQQLEEIMAAARGAVDSPLYDAADAWDFPAPEFIIDQLIPMLGTLWVGGLPKRGKSLLVLYLALAIACRRRDVFGKFKVLAHPKMLYITREDGGPRLNERRADILSAWTERPEPGALRFVIKARIDLLNPEHVAWLRDMCILEGRTVIVLDTWTALSPGADPLSPKDQARLAAVVVQLAEDIHGLVIVVDHSRKNRPEGSILSSADIFGAPQKWAAAEHVLMLDHAGGDESRWEIFVEGKDADSTRFLLTKSARGSGQEKLVHAGDINTLADRSKLTGNENRQKCLDAIRNAWLTRGEVEAKTGMSKATCTRHLTALVESGQADQMGTGRSTRYRAVDATHPPSESDCGMSR